MTPPKLKGLGRGLDALLAGNTGESGNSGELRTLEVGLLPPGKYQPRTRMDPGSLEELAESIKIRLVTPSVRESESPHEVNVPAGSFVSKGHAWVNVHMNGLVRMGIDDFTQKTIGRIDAVEMPASGTQIRKGETLFTLRHGEHKLVVPSPVSGKVAGVNAELRERPELIKLKPYQLGWVCTMDPTNLTHDLAELRIGSDAVSWYRQEINRYGELIRAALREREASGKSVRNEKGGELDDLSWEVFEHAFIRP